ncbi:unnamed protein product (macronuclear) [Paramecium tetraurelia]|uniref:Uncharacterized protein n=1 Tax=Paramecium tetraurelia TaxID=5888 RepID=A0ECK0_PARTE|nr:uncharacterized protein GSPATT00003886001 [Paramecium tetraurelia]CAK93017.1 unnamed protein product [Paramecium tetraurelia]|eukprot:XP_001460414.1 hypothetical protein (macronuclear) [Paramecium tetraurelia strain d4-2]
MKTMDDRAFKRPLPKQFYCVLLKYEEKATQEDICMDELVQMTQMYGEIVSYYDSQMDPITYYFMDKQHQLLQQIVRKSKQDQEDILKNLIMANQSDIPIIKIDNYKQKKMVHLYELEEVQKVNERVCENIVGQFEKNNEANDSTVQEEFQKQQNNLYLRLANRIKKKQDYKRNGDRLSNSSINVYQVPFRDYDEGKLES